MTHFHRHLPLKKKVLHLYSCTCNERNHLDALNCYVSSIWGAQLISGLCRWREHEQRRCTCDRTLVCLFGKTSRATNVGCVHYVVINSWAQRAGVWVGTWYRCSTLPITTAQILASFLHSGKKWNFDRGMFEYWKELTFNSSSRLYAKLSSSPLDAIVNAQTWDLPCRLTSWGGGMYTYCIS